MPMGNNDSFRLGDWEGFAPLGGTYQDQYYSPIRLYFQFDPLTPLPLSPKGARGEGRPHPALSSAGACRVRGSPKDTLRINFLESTKWLVVRLEKR